MGGYKEISVSTLPISKSAALLTLSFYLVVQHSHFKSNFREFSQRFLLRSLSKISLKKSHENLLPVLL